MEKLSSNQTKALEKFPDDGWYRVDNVPSFWTWVDRKEYIASILAKKGYLEKRLITPPNVSFHMWYWVYRKVGK